MSAPTHAPAYKYGIHEPRIRTQAEEKLAQAAYELAISEEKLAVAEARVAVLEARTVFTCTHKY